MVLTIFPLSIYSLSLLPNASVPSRKIPTSLEVVSYTSVVVIGCLRIRRKDFRSSGVNEVVALKILDDGKPEEQI